MSQYKTTRRKQNPLNILLRVAGIVVAVVAVVFIARALVKSQAQAIIPLYPDSFDTALMSRKQLSTKLYELQSTLDSYNSHIAGVSLLQSENTALKAELGRDPQSRGILAHVLTVPNRSFYDTFVIDAGSMQGVQVEQQAYAFNAIALGTVSSVSDNTAVVTLFSAPGRETSGTAVGSDVAVTLIGRGGGEYEVRMPRDVHFDIGSAIALQSVYPAVLAEVQKIITDPRDPFQRLLAKAPVNLTALKWVVVR
ncbi:MAG TPA: rod shape-determining protein MreC [Candidatus Paceibacterota bacterium]